MRCCFWKVDTCWLSMLHLGCAEGTNRTAAIVTWPWLNVCAGWGKEGEAVYFGSVLFPCPPSYSSSTTKAIEKAGMKLLYFSKLFQGPCSDLTCICCTLCVFLVVWDWFLFCFSQPFTFFCEYGLRIWRLSSYSTASFVEILRGASEFCLFMNHSHTGLIYPYHSFTWCAYPEQFTGSFGIKCLAPWHINRCFT